MYKKGLTTRNILGAVKTARIEDVKKDIFSLT
jgi:hypothetical protein